MDWVKRHQELVLQKFRNEQVFMPPSMENELKAIRALLDTQEENQALTAENRELRELAQELALARELLKLIVDEAFAAQMCDKAKDVDPELGAAIYKMLPGIKKFLSTSRVPGLVTVKGDEPYPWKSEWIAKWHEARSRLEQDLTRAKEGE